jgi:hypothetical protein
MRYLLPVFFATLLAISTTSMAEGTSQCWVSLFNGKNLDGWHTLPGGEWRVIDGAIVGTSPSTEPRHGLLLTNKEFDDFNVRLKFRVSKGDSGFYFRVSEVGGIVGVHGFQVEVDSSHETGGLYETGDRGWVVKPEVKELRKHYIPGEWSELKLSANGGHVVVHINGYKTAELANDPGRSNGRIALQLHGGMEMLVQFKDIEISQKNRKTGVSKRQRGEPYQ